MPSSQTAALTFVVVARIPPSGVAAFQAYEDAVLPPLKDFGGQLERRLRNSDGTLEVHIVSFPSKASFQNYRNDSRRVAQASLLENASAKLELFPMTNVS